MHHRLAAGDRDASVERLERGRKALQPVEDLFHRNVRAVLEMPRVRVVAIRASQQAPRYEQHHAHAGPVVSGRGLVGMAIAKGAFAIVLKQTLVRSVG